MLMVIIISKPKVNDLEVPIAVQQKVFRFEVSVVKIVLLRMVKLVLWRILKILLCKMPGWHNLRDFLAT